MFIWSCGDADFYAVWIGDEGSNYSKKDERGVDKDGNITWTNTGTNFSIKKGAQVIKIYGAAGSYTIILVATNTSTGDTDVEFIVASYEKQLLLLRKIVEFE